jgi:hypothetical protein
MKIARFSYIKAVLPGLPCGYMDTGMLHSLIPLEDFKAILGLDDQEDALSRYCLITATFTIEQYCKRRLYAEDTSLPMAVPPSGKRQKYLSGTKGAGNGETVNAGGTVQR